MTPSEYQNNIQVGQSLYLKADYGAAEKLFAKTMNSYPDKPEAIAWFAKVRLSQGSPSDARTLYETAFAKGLEKSSEHLTNLAICYAFQGNRDGARTLLEGAIATDATYEPAYGALARHCVIMGDYEAAERYASAGIKRFPSNVPCFESRALARLAMLNLDGADADAQKSLELDAKSTDGLLCKASVLMAKGKLIEGQNLLEQARVNEPNNCEVLLSLGSALQSNGQLEKAESSFRDAFKLQPLNWRVYQCLASLELRRNKSALGLDYVNAALELRDAPVLHYLRGALLVQLSRWNEAKAEFTLATAANPLDVLSWISLAEIEAQNPSERNPAIEHARKVLELDQNDSSADRARQILKKLNA